MHNNHGIISLIDSVGKKVDVFAVISSVSADEITRAEQLGFKSKFKLVMRSSEYGGQFYVELNGMQYSVYRTYDNGRDNIELYVEEKLGVF